MGSVPGMFIGECCDTELRKKEASEVPPFPSSWQGVVAFTRSVQGPLGKGPFGGGVSRSRRGRATWGCSWAQDLWTASLPTL